jgi:hypothetical protein
MIKGILQRVRDALHRIFPTPSRDESLVPTDSTFPVAGDWPAQLHHMVDIEAATNRSLALYAGANIDAIRAALGGFGPDAALGTAPGMGARMVVNISASHVPAVCSASRAGEARPYKNGYDLGSYRVGDASPDRALKLREIVDAALPLPPGKSPADIYFGAMELNGTGVHFYGDVCLVLKDVSPETPVLDRNSYDLVRAPLRDMIEDKQRRKMWAYRRAEVAKRISGQWGRSHDLIGAIKILRALGVHERRVTTGQISDALRDDEDYVEILRVQPFGTGDLSEARLTAADVAYDASIDDRRRTGVLPQLEALLWRDRRRIAERELLSTG